MQIEELIEDFSFLEDWDDRYKYLIELGNQLVPLAESEMNAATRVEGCVSQVWLVCEQDDQHNDPVLLFRGNSDAHIVRGLIAVTLAIFSGKPASQIITTDEAEFFNRIGLQEHITPQRSNGLRSMVQRIKAYARAAMQQ